MVCRPTRLAGVGKTKLAVIFPQSLDSALRVLSADTILFELACQPILAFYEEAITGRYGFP